MEPNKGRRKKEKTIPKTRVMKKEEEKLESTTRTRKGEVVWLVVVAEVSAVLVEVLL
jgi:hypothetical protein